MLAFVNPSLGEEVSIQHQSLTLNANLEIAEGKSMQDGVVLILHGMMAHNRMEIIEASQQALLDNDHSSLAITLSLGVDSRKGFFDCALLHTHTMDEALGELAAWVQWLREKSVNKIVLMAHSRGANQAMVYTVEHDDPLISHIILLAPNTTANAKPNYEARYGKSFDNNLARVQKLIDAGKRSQMLEELDFSYCPKATVSAATFYSY
ncbi:MAG: alpha/beta hydrolase, partial [Gammaproteobacteria bacterium]|nr:alpha/beta hydrolase [Gammaproteobacteria bacterium]